MAHPLSGDLDHVLECTRPMWEELRGRRIFVTGGTGFYGCWLLETFLWANHRLGLDASAVVLTRNPDAFARRVPHLAIDPALRFVAGDVRDFDFPEGEFSHVVNAATDASSYVAASQLAYLDVIAKGTQRTLEFARQSGARKFLFASSGGVYGRQPPELERIDEDYLGAPDVTGPGACYPEGKRFAELLCVLYAREHGIEPKLARGFSFLGPYMPLGGRSAITGFMRDALNGTTIKVNSDGTTYRTYLYGADLAIWLWTILFKGVSCRPYNVGSGAAVSIADTARAVAKAFDRQVHVDIAGTPDPTKLPERYVPSLARAESELGLYQTIGFDEAIARSVAWYSRRPPAMVNE